MDITTILGLLLGFVLMAGSIVVAGEPLMTFSDTGSYLIVFGGAGAAFLVEPASGPQAPADYPTGHNPEADSGPEPARCRQQAPTETAASAFG